MQERREGRRGGREGGGGATSVRVCVSDVWGSDGSFIHSAHRPAASCSRAAHFGLGSPGRPPPRAHVRCWRGAPSDRGPLKACALGQVPWWATALALGAGQLPTWVHAPVGLSLHAGGIDTVGAGRDLRLRPASQVAGAVLTAGAVAAQAHCQR